MPAAPTTRRRPASSNRRLLLIGAAVLAAVLLFVFYRSRSANAQSSTSSGNPGPDQTGSSSIAPTGGAASTPGQLPAALLSAPDALQQQVQQTDAGSSTSSGTSSSTQAATATAAPVTVAGITYQQSAPGSDAFIPTGPTRVAIGGPNVAGATAPVLQSNTGQLLRGGVQGV